MGRALPKFVPEPRIWNTFQVCCRLQWSDARFRKNRKWLADNGFPEFDSDLNGWDANAIEHWLDRRAGLLEHSLAELDRELDGWVPSR